MGLLENYCTNKFNSILISKLSVKRLKNYPEFKCFLLYFIINTRYYKKSLLLFYLMLNLIFGGIFFFKKKNTGLSIVLKLIVRKKKMFNFLHSFVYVYLPLVNVSENIYKKTVSSRKVNVTNLFFYRFHFFSFPAISELDLFYENFELIYDFVIGFKLQLDIVIKNQFLFSAGEILLRMHKFPCLIKLKVLT